MMKYMFELDGAFNKSSRLKFEAASTAQHQQCYGLVVSDETVVVYGCGRTYDTDRPVSWEVVITGHEARAIRDDGLEVVILPRPGSVVVYNNGSAQTEFIFTGGLLIPQVD